jgi:hypothetical protein
VKRAINCISRCRNTIENALYEGRDSTGPKWKTRVLLMRGTHSVAQVYLVASLLARKPHGWDFIPSKQYVVPRASPKYVVNTAISGLLPRMSSEPLRKSTHFLHQYTSPFATLTSVLFYKEGLYMSTQHCSKRWRGSPFTGSPQYHLVRVEIITSILVLIVSILL